MTKTTSTKAYRQLVNEISHLYEGSQTVTVDGYWQIGQRIVEEEQGGEARAAYGQGLILKLSQDLSQKYGGGFSVRNIHRMRSFYLQNQAGIPQDKMSWSHHVELLSVTDESERKHLVKKATDDRLSARQVRDMLKVHKAAKNSPVLQGLTDVSAVGQIGIPEESPTTVKLRRSKFLTLMTYFLRDDGAVDCGFFVHRKVSKVGLKGVQLLDIPHHTYPAIVARIIDGDTFEATIDIGFDTQVFERLRLRGIDTPEINTPEGKRAKEFLKDVIPEGSHIVIKSYKADSFGRFLADIMYMPQGQESDDPQHIADHGVFLNLELLQRGLAVSFM